ncbi:MAG TPA: hypothetical protein VFV84_13255 [Burkholderiales bacterium]|nr:hypothetical protein [Burkholderiales bacterium]
MPVHITFQPAADHLRFERTGERPPTGSAEERVFDGEARALAWLREDH